MPRSTTSLGIDARTLNPFNGKTEAEMDKYLEEFMRETGIEDHYRLFFQKGMFIAQNGQLLDHPEYFPHGLSITDEEREFLELDAIDKGETWAMNLKKWRLPGPLWRLVTLCAIGAVVQGWDESAVNSAQSYYQDAYKIWIYKPTLPNGSAPNTIVPEPKPWLVGLVNSAPYLCCVLSCWLTYPLNAKFGRRWTIFISCLFSAVFAIVQSFADSWETLFVCRFFLGFGIGPKSATIPIYAAEAAPANVRGGLVMLWQVFTALGIMCGYISGVAFRSVLTDASKCQYGLPDIDMLGIGCSLKWRLMLGSPVVAPIVLMMYIFTQPESPRWLVGRGHILRIKPDPDRHADKAKSNYRDAFEGLIKLRHTKLQAARDMFLIYWQLLRQAEAMEIHRKNNKWYENGVFELLTNARNRRAFVASLTCMFAQQFCGVNVIVYYSGEVLRRASSITIPGSEKILLYSLGFGIINFTAALPAFYTIDTVGRRTLLLVTFPFLAIFQLLTAIAFMGPNTSPHALPGTPATGTTVTRQWPLALVGMYLFGLAYSPGEGPVPFVYSAESMPLYIRDIGMGCVTSINWFFNWLIAITAPYFFDVFSAWGAFLWYAVWCVVLWFMIFFLVPETRALSLEDLDHVFGQKTGDFSKAGRDQIAWLWSKYIRRRPDARFRPVRPVVEHEMLALRSTTKNDSGQACDTAKPSVEQVERVQDG